MASGLQSIRHMSRVTYAFLFVLLIPGAAFAGEKTAASAPVSTLQRLKTAQRIGVIRQRAASQPSRARAKVLSAKMRRSALSATPRRSREVEGTLLMVSARLHEAKAARLSLESRANELRLELAAAKSGKQHLKQIVVAGELELAEGELQLADRYLHELHGRLQELEHELESSLRYEQGAQTGSTP